MTGQPLAVFVDIAECDANDHPVQIITDGFTAYAFGEAAECPLVRDEGTVLTVSCNQPRPDDDQCHGHVQFDLATTGRWITDPQAITRLIDHGAAVDR